jgi:hypothetical protein
MAGVSISLAESSRIKLPRQQIGFHRIASHGRWNPIIWLMRAIACDRNEMIDSMVESVSFTLAVSAASRSYWKGALGFLLKKEFSLGEVTYNELSRMFQCRITGTETE